MAGRLRSRLRALWRWRRQESELDEELAFHLSEEADERIADGLAPDEARRAARKDFGNVAWIREETRDVWAWGSAERLVQDVRYGVRTMRRHPSFAAVAVVTLALGIGATTAILNVVNTLVLRPLPLPNADRLVVLFATSPKRALYRDTTSFLDFSAWRDQSHAFTGAAAYRQDAINVTGDGVPESVAGVRASHEFLSVVGVSPAVGRSFDAEEQRRTQAVALISHRLWTTRYGSDPRVLGRTILLNEVSHAIVGVLPAGFQFPPFIDTDVIVPVPERPCRSCGYIRGIARLRSAVSRSAAQQELDAIASRLEQAFPDSNEGRGVNVVPLHEVAVGQVRTPLLVLLGAGLCVLLIGCANVGNLVLTKGIARQRELAVRSALGAGRGRLVRQLLTESLSLSVVAAVLGAVLALWGSAFLVASLSQQFGLPEIPFDWTMLGVAFVLAAFCGVLSGLPPALMVRRVGLTECLRQDSRTQSSGVTERRLGHLLIVGQTAMTVMLLIGAGLLVNSFIRLQRVELGVDTHRALTADLLLSKRYLDPPQREAYVQRLLNAIGVLPGVVAVGLHVDQPFTGGGRRETFRVEGHDDPRPGSGHPAAFNIVSGDFFRAMDIPVVWGRGFNADDTSASIPVAVINETMARRFWPTEEAIGKRLQFYYEKNRERWLTVIGVVREVRYHGRLMDPAPQVFVPSQQPFYKAQDAHMSLVVRTSMDPASMINAVRASVWAVEKDQPITNLQPMDRVLWESAAAPRVYMMLLGIFAIIALVIASAGIYGASAYSVVRRTQEIGIRLALGGTPGQTLALVMRQGLITVFIGASVGVAGALALTKIISGILFGITPTDTPTFLAVLMLFAGVAIVSIYIPARRAAMIDPTLALK
ncbi:MAG TPA: ABC transporter permease [Vicinamibacterales bacterium]|nr:ABC transporter permease [Vicinamibacterales bacterium]